MGTQVRGHCAGYVVCVCVKSHCCKFVENFLVGRWLHQQVVPAICE